MKMVSVYLFVRWNGGNTNFLCSKQNDKKVSDTFIYDIMKQQHKGECSKKGKVLGYRSKIISDQSQKQND